MEEIWIVDGHCDSLGDLTDGKRDLTGSETGHWDIIKARKGKIGLQFFAAFIESEYKPFSAAARGLAHLETALKFIDAHAGQVFPVKTREDLKGLPKTDSLGLLLHVEGGEILGESLFMLDLIFRLGVRSIGLTWNQRNAIADGIGEPDGRGGLSRFGVKVIEQMNHKGMVIDVSHINQAGFWDVLDRSRHPVIASHSCAYSLCHHPRNLNDRQLKALAQANGVVGVNFCEDFLSETGKAGIDDVVRHICYIADLAGVETVGFGSDFDGIPSAPAGLEDAAKYPLLVEKLLAGGFNREEIEKICHGNFIRVLSNVLL